MKDVAEGYSGRLLTPHALQIDRGGDVVVKMKASVFGSERFSFTVLRKNMQAALDSLEVADNRDTIPLISFSSPIRFDVNKIQSDEAWDAMLREARGARVQIESVDQSVDGTLMGIQRDGAANFEEISPTCVVILSNGKVTLHRVDAIRSLSFLDDDVTERLKRESSLQTSVVDTLHHYRIVIVAHGDGKGVLHVSYRQKSPYVPAFETFYIANDAPDENGCRKTKRFFTIRNPLHYDVTDVEVQLQTGVYRRKDYCPAYAEVELQSSGSAGFSVRSVSDDDEVFDQASSISTTSIRALFGVLNYNYNIKEKLSLKVGESMRILHSETAVRSEGQCSYGTTETSAVDSQYIQNVGGEFLGAGTWFLHDKETETNRLFYYSDIAGNQEFANYMTWSTVPRCRGVKQRIPEIGRAVQSEMVANKLVVHYEWRVTTVYRFQNESQLELDMFLKHESVISSRRRSHIEATLQSVDKEAHSGEEGEVTKLSPCGFKIGVRYFMMKVAAFKETIVTVKEESTPDCLMRQEYMIPRDCNIRKLQFLESRGAVNESTMKMLREVMMLVREFVWLKQDRKVHEQKLEKVYGSLIEEKEEEEDKDDLLSNHLDSIARAKKIKEGVTEALDRVESDMAETKLKIKKLVSQLSCCGQTM